MDLQVELSVYDKANLLVIACPELPPLINVTYLSPLACYFSLCPLEKMALYDFANLFFRCRAVSRDWRWMPHYVWRRRAAAIVNGRVKKVGIESI